MEHSVARLAGTPPGGESQADGRPVLRVGISAAAAIQYGSAIARVWRQAQPQGLLRLAGGPSPQLLAGLQHGEFDLVIAPRPRRFQADDIECHALFGSTPSIYARAGHPLARARTLAALEGAGWVVAGPQGSPGNVIEEAHRVRGLPPPRIEVECTDYATLLHLVAGTDLLGVLPHPALVPPGLQPDMVALRVREGLPRYEVCVFRPAAGQGRAGEGAEQVLRELIGR